MAEHDLLGHTSADDEYQATPPGSTYEHTDASIGIIVKFLIWLVVSAIVIHIGLGVMYGALVSRWTETAEQPYPLAAGQGPRLPPAPRLQQDPQEEFRTFRQGEQQLIEGYGWMNREAGLVHIPVAEAMRLTVERGLLSDSPAVDEPPAAPGLMPSDASAGRTLELRRQ